MFLVVSLHAPNSDSNIDIADWIYYSLRDSLMVHVHVMSLAVAERRSKKQNKADKEYQDSLATGGSQSDVMNPHVRVGRGGASYSIQQMFAAWLL